LSLIQENTPGKVQARTEPVTH